MTSIFRSIVHSSFRRSIQIGSFVQQVLLNQWVFLTSVADFTFTRAGDQTGINSSGVLVTSTANNPAFASGDGVLLEDTAENLATFSELFDDASYTAVGMSVTPAAATAPDGTTTAYSMQGDGISAFPNLAKVIGGTFSAAVPFTVSLFVSEGTSDKFLFRVNDTTNVTHYTQQFDWIANVPTEGTAQTSTLGTATTKIEQLGSTGIWRVELTVTPTAGGGSRNVDLRPDWNNASTTTVFIWGLQPEDNDFATSYISTAGSTVIRAATSQTRARPFPANGISAQVKPTVQFDATDDKGSDALIFDFSDGTSNNYLRATYDQTNDQIHLKKRIAAGTEVIVSTSAAALNYVFGQQLNVRVRAGTDGISMWVDALSKVTIATGDAPTDWSTLLTTIEINPSFQAVESLKIVNEAKSDSFMANLT